MTLDDAATERRRNWDLLLRVCRTDSTGLGADVARCFPGREPGSWQGFLRLMDDQGAAPLGAAAILSAEEDAVPAEVRASLETRVRLGSLRARIQVGELLAILEAFRARDVDAVAHKGPALSALAYGREGLRDSVDLDLVVRERDVTAAEQALRERGYRRSSPGDLDAREEAGWRRVWKETEFVSADGWTYVDLHWRICPERFPFRVDGPRPWSWRHRVVLGGSEVPVFAPEVQVVLLCVHGAEHAWSQLIWLCDVDRVIRAFPALDWEGVCAIAEEGRCRRAVGFGLLLAARLLGTEVPAAPLARLGVDKRLERLGAGAEGQLARGGIHRPWWLAHFDLLPFHFQVFDRGLDGLGYVTRTLLTPRAWDWEVIKLRLPDSLYLLRYPARLARLILTFPREALRRIPRRHRA